MITYYHVSNFTTLIMPIMACNVKLARIIEGYGHTDETLDLI